MLEKEGQWFNELKLMLILYLLPHVDTAEWSHVTVFVMPENFAHGAGWSLTGETVDVDLLLLVLFTHQLLLL